MNSLLFKNVYLLHLYKFKACGLAALLIAWFARGSFGDYNNASLTLAPLSSFLCWWIAIILTIGFILRLDYRNECIVDPRYTL